MSYNALQPHEPVRVHVAEAPNASTTQPSSTPAASQPSSPPSGDTITISLRTLTGQLLPLSLPRGEANAPQNISVRQLKQRIDDTHGMPADFIRLIYNGRELKDDDPVSAYRVEDGSVLHMLLRAARPPVAQAAPAQQPQFQQQYPPQYPPQYPQAYPPALAPYEAEVVVAIAAPPSARFGRTLQLSRAVKLFSIIDCLFLILWSWSYYPLLAGLVLAAAGYYGAKTLKAPYVGVYIVYLLLSIAARIYWMVETPSYLYIFLLSVSVLIEFYILYITYQLIVCIRQLTENERAELLALQTPNRVGFF